MSTAPQTVVLNRARVSDGWRVELGRWFYFGMALFAAVMVVWGFGHTVGANLVYATVPRPRILWVHASVFSLWVLFYILQSGLVRTRRVRVHRTLGWFGAGLAAVMVPLGITTAVAMGRFHTRVLHEAGAETFQIVAFGDMMSFAVLAGLGLWWRKKPDRHRRLFFLATAALLGAAYGRFDFVFRHNLFYQCVEVTMLLGVLRDWLVDRRVNAVYKVAIPSLVVLHGLVLFMFLKPVGWWVRLAHGWMG